MPDWTDTIANRRNGLVPGFIGKDVTLPTATPAANPAAAVTGPLSARPAANVFGPGFWLGDDNVLYHSDGATWLPTGVMTARGRVVLAEDFAVPDRHVHGHRPRFGPPAMFAAGLATGQSDANIVGGRLQFTSPTNSPPTVYHHLGEEVGEVVGSVILRGDGDGSQQHIIGLTPTVYGGGADQFGWSATKSDWGTGDGLKYHWCVFGYGGGGAGKIAFGNFPADLPAGAYRFSMRRIDATTVLLTFPNGQTLLVPDTHIAAAWGPAVGYQQRRITNGAGNSDFTSVVAIARAPIPPLAAPVGANGLVLPGAAAPAITGVEALIPLPTLSQDLELRIKWMPAAIATSYELVSLRSTRAGGVVPSLSAWRLFTTSGSLLDLGVSVDGTTIVNKGTTYTALGIAAGSPSINKITRTAADGIIRMYNTPDNGATWVKQGGDLTGAPTGPLAASLEPVRIGCLDTTVTGSLAGRVDWVEIYDGIGGPLLGRWAPGVQVDGQGNSWHLVGTQWGWA